MNIELYCDGACKGNPGPGGYGYIVRVTPEKEDNCTTGLSGKGSAKETTNNQMELQGAIEGLKSIKEKYGVDNNVIITTDSNYVVKGLSEWCKKWILSDFKGIKNSELWKELIKLSKEFKSINLVWVKGHAGHIYNEMCDKLANQAIDEGNFLKDKNYENI